MFQNSIIIIVMISSFEALKTVNVQCGNRFYDVKFFSSISRAFSYFFIFVKSTTKSGLTKLCEFSFFSLVKASHFQRLCKNKHLRLAGGDSFTGRKKFQNPSKAFKTRQKAFTVRQSSQLIHSPAQSSINLKSTSQQ